MANIRQKIHDNKTKRQKERLVCLGSAFFFMSSAYTPVVAMASPDTLQQNASTEDISTIKKYFASGQVKETILANLLAKNFELTNYELLLMSEIIRQDIVARTQNETQQADALRDLVDLQEKYGEEYKEIFGHLPEELKGKGLVSDASDYEGSDTSSDKKAPIPFGNLPNWSNSWGGNASTPTTPAKNSPSFYDSDEAKDYIAKNYPASSFKEDIEKAKSPEQLADSMSLINIRKEPNPVSSDPHITIGSSKNKTPIQNPQDEFDHYPYDMSTAYPNNKNGTVAMSTEMDMDKKELSDIVYTLSEQQAHKAKHFFLSIDHNIDYIKTKGTGNVPLDVNKLDANGHPYKKKVIDERQLEETLSIGLGVRLHKAVDAVIGIVAENEDGLLFREGTKWEFGNVMFKFHPERINRLELQKLNSEGFIIENNGKIIGRSLGHGTALTTDVESGAAALRAGDSTLLYDRDEGFSFANTGSKYFLGFGKLALDFTSYTLQLSECKAVEVGYHDANEAFTLIYGTPQKAAEGKVIPPPSGSPPGTSPKILMGHYDQALTAAQYVTKKLIPNMELSFNFAQVKDKGSLGGDSRTIPQKEKTSAYSLAFKGSLGNTAMDGEIARATTKTDGAGTSKNSTAAYVDLTHMFSKRLAMTIHALNIDKDYYTGSLTEDKTGEDLLTTNKGDGLPDYLYEVGTKGIDLTFNYVIPESRIATSFGYTRYSSLPNKENKTTKAPFLEKTSYFASFSKIWDLTNKRGDSYGTIALQHRFEKDKVSNRDYTETLNDTTLSYQGEPWKNGEVALDAQNQFSVESGDRKALEVTVAHHFYPMTRVSITPKVEYQRKIGSKGKDLSVDNSVDMSTLINSLVIGYELVPNEVTVNLLMSKEDYNIKKAEIDEASGKNVDGEPRNVLGVGLGLVWQPKKIPGLEAGISWRKDKTEYKNTHEITHPTTWEYSLSYSHPVSDKVQAVIAYDYKSTKDAMQPKYDEVTKTASIQLNIDMGDAMELSLSHEYESTYKANDPKANYSARTTMFQMRNHF